MRNQNDLLIGDRLPYRTLLYLSSAPHGKERIDLGSFAWLDFLALGREIHNLFMAVNIIYFGMHDVNADNS